MIRIGLGFNENDDDQHQAAAILKGLGRRKSSYITKLILADSGAIKSDSKTNSLTEDDVRRIVFEELSKMNISTVSKQGCSDSSDNTDVKNNNINNAPNMNEIDALLDDLGNFK